MPLQPKVRCSPKQETRSYTFKLSQQHYFDDGYGRQLIMKSGSRGETLINELPAATTFTCGWRVPSTVWWEMQMSVTQISSLDSWV